MLALMACMMATPVMAVEPEGDGDFSYVEHSDTKRSEKTNCQITVSTECPEGFGLNTYVVLSDKDGQMYRVSLSEENGYKDHIFLPDGEYSVVEAKVYEDNTGRYPFEQIEGEQTFSIEDGDTAGISFRLADYDKIAKTIVDVEGEKSDKEEVVSEDKYPTLLEGVMMSGIGELYYPVEPSGSGIGEMMVSGNAKGDYDLLVTITKAGVIGEARFSLSLDGGESTVGEDVTAEKFLLKDFGLTLYFSTKHDSDELQEGDAFRAAIPENFAVDTARYDDANIMVIGHPEKDHNIEINILSSGGRGEAKFTVSMDGGNTVAYTDTIPYDGIFGIEDDLAIAFSDSDGFEKGRTYASEVKSNAEAVSMVPVYILIGVLIVAILFGYGYLLSKKEKMTDYRLQKWDDLQDEEAYK